MQNGNCKTMVRNQKMTLNEKLIEEKTFAMGKAIEGMTAPEVMAVIGSLTINFVDNIHEKCEGFEYLAAEWLEQLRDQVLNLYEEVAEHDLGLN